MTLRNEQFELAIERFEEAWHSGDRPDLPTFVQTHVDRNLVLDSDSRQLVVELVKIDIEYRWRRRDDQATAIVERYSSTFPCLNESSTLLELLGEEYRVRQRWGDRPNRSTFSGRLSLSSDDVAPVLDRIDAEIIAERSEDIRRKAEAALHHDAMQLDLHEPSNWPKLEGYEIGGVLGQGGMGVVYRARDTRLGRDVAIKTILGDYSTTKNRERLMREAESIARLQHPNVVQVFDVHNINGRLLCVLELVAAGSLADRLREVPLKSKEAAALVATLARAIDYAHSQGIIHRDLKPSNVLLPHPENVESPKVSDFGLAKWFSAESAAEATASEMIVGTPSYMSPEQIRSGGTIGPATDVYSLGAILYECLTGRPPFRTATTMETLQLVCSHDPIPPSRLGITLPKDVETICLKCLEKEPVQRYATAAALADDLEAYLAGRPIQARPANIVERLWKWSKRRPAVASLLGVAIMLFVVLVGGSLAYQASLRRALSIADEERRRADRNSEQAFEAIGELLDQVGYDRLSEAPEMEGIRRDLVARATVYYERLLQEPSNSSVNARLQHASALLRLSELDIVVGKNDRAKEDLDRAAKMFERLVHEYPAHPVVRDRVGKMHYSLGHWHATSGENSAAEASYLRAIEFWESIPKTPAVSLSLGAVHQSFGDLLSSTRRPIDAEKYFNHSLEAFEQFRRDSSDRFTAELKLAACHYDRALFFNGTGRAEVAEREVREAILLWEAWRSDSRFTSRLKSTLGECYSLLGFMCNGDRAPEGRKLLEQVIAIQEELANRFPNTPVYRDNLARGHQNLGAFLLQASLPADAEVSLRKSIDVWERLRSDRPDFVGVDLQQAEALANLALLLAQRGTVDESKTCFARAVAILEPLAKNKSTSRITRSYAATLINYGNLQRDSGDASGSLETLVRAVDTIETELCKDSTNRDARSFAVAAHGSRAMTLISMQRSSESVPDWKRLIELSDQPLGAEHQLLYADALVRSGNAEQAISVVKELVARDESDIVLYNSACVCSLAMVAASKTAASSEEYGRMAMKYLTQLKEKGYFGEPSRKEALRDDPDLNSLRETAAFRELFDFS